MMFADAQPVLLPVGPSGLSCEWLYRAWDFQRNGEHAADKRLLLRSLTATAARMTAV